jgi:hypothetical protein
VSFPMFFKNAHKNSLIIRDFQWAAGAGRN